jgi:hypothetical protein
MSRFDYILASAFMAIAATATAWALAGHEPDSALVMGCIICALVITRTRRG